jgi:hypothetical protein
MFLLVLAVPALLVVLAGYVLGHAALKGRVVRVEPRSMRISIE